MYKCSRVMGIRKFVSVIRRGVCVKGKLIVVGAMVIL